jgi:predicted RNase H-like HicB family nuclease
VKFTAAIRREGAWYVAQCLEVDVASQGDTIDSAKNNLREALELYFEGDSDSAKAVVPAIVTTIDVSAA